MWDLDAVTRGRLRDPEREKRLQVRERLDVWGENQKGSRKLIPLARARNARQYRHAVAAALRGGAEDLTIRRKDWSKWVGPTRAEHLERMAEQRKKLDLTPVRTEETRARRQARRRRSKRAGTP